MNASRRAGLRLARSSACWRVAPSARGTGAGACTSAVRQVASAPTTWVPLGSAADAELRDVLREIRKAGASGADVTALVDRAEAVAQRRGRFHGRAVAVTGGAKGIGEGCVRVFCAEGGLAGIIDRDIDAANALAEEINADGSAGRAVAIECDASDPSQVEAAVQATVAEYDRLDCVVNNVGWHPPAVEPQDLKTKDFEALLTLNLTSAFVASRTAVPHIKATKGTIVNISSVVSVEGQAQAASYAASKGAMNSLTKALAIDLGPFGCRVNAICPSNVLTPLWMEWVNTLPDPDEGIRMGASKQVLNRMSEIEEMGTIALFLATEDSSFITGQVIVADGGSTLAKA